MSLACQVSSQSVSRGYVCFAHLVNAGVDVQLERLVQCYGVAFQHLLPMTTTPKVNTKPHKDKNTRVFSTRTAVVARLCMCANTNRYT